MNRFLVIVPTIVATLRRQAFIHLLLLAEVAMLTAVIINALAVVATTQEHRSLSTGVDEADIGVIRSIGVIGATNDSTAAQNLQLLREIPNVESAAYGAPPLMNTSTTLVRRSADSRSTPVTAYLFQGSQGLARTLDLDVVAGRSFTTDDPPSARSLTDESVLPALVTDALSRRLYPGSGALGKVLYTDGNPLRVIGIVKHLRSQLTGAESDDFSIVSEVRIEQENVGGAFTIRASKGRLDKALPLAAAEMEKHNPGHVQADVFTLTSKRRDYFSSDMAVTRMLITVVTILLSMLACGLAALTYFLVQKRRRQIGVMRALGAMRRDILFFFACENLLVSGTGVGIGAVAAMILSHQLAERYGLTAPPGSLTMATAVGTLLLCQLAVALTARRALRHDASALMAG